MKVLYLVPRGGRKGQLTAYTFLDEEIRALASAGIRAYVMARRGSVKQEHDGIVRSPLPREPWIRARARTLRFILKSSAWIPPSGFFSFGDLYHGARLERLAAELVRREKVDLVHSHFAWPQGFGGSLVKQITGVPLVACLRGADILVDAQIGYGARGRVLYDLNLRRLLRVADRTLYFSDFMRNEGMRLGARPDRAQTIQKAVDLAQFGVLTDRAAARRQLGFGDNPMILAVGGLIPRKGIDLILEALANLRQSFDFSFVVCGEGPERGKLERLARQLSLADRTHLVGQVSREDIPKFFGACDLLVHAPVLEAAGNVLFEAMGAGRPIVCTAAGGPAEYVENSVSGFVVPVGDTAALADRIAALLADPTRADRMGLEGLRIARTRYAYPRLVQDIISIYEDVLKGRSSTATRTLRRA